MLRESDNFYNAQSTFSEFIGNVKPKETDDSHRHQQFTSAVAGKPRRFINKEAIASIVGPREESHKQVVVMTAKDVADTHRDVYTSVPKKVIMKDLLNVLKRDSRLRNRPLHYMLLN